MLTKEQRIIFIAFCVGTIDSKYSNAQNSRLIITINGVLKAQNENEMTVEEKDILDTIDDLVYLFRMSATNREGWRSKKFG